MEQFSTERQPLVDELAVIKKALADLEAAVMRDAAVIGATVTKSYLSAGRLPAFDVVIIDEASMVLLPALYYAAELVLEKVVISGDFRQLPPIVPTDQQAIRDEIGMDVFHAAGIVSAVEFRKSLPRLVLLDEQHRMHDSIWRLISSFMYSGQLDTASTVEARDVQIPLPLVGSLTIVDTSSLWPFETQTTSFSRYNLVHAIVVRNLALKLQELDHVQMAPLAFVRLTQRKPSLSGVSLTTKVSVGTSRQGRSTAIRATKRGPSSWIFPKASAAGISSAVSPR